MKEAVQLGAARAEYLASTEVQLARRGAGLQARSSNDRIVGYIRTLTGAENCALCYVASTQRYNKKTCSQYTQGVTVERCQFMAGKTQAK